MKPETKSSLILIVVMTVISLLILIMTCAGCCPVATTVAGLQGTLEVAEDWTGKLDKVVEDANEVYPVAVAVVAAAQTICDDPNITNVVEAAAAITKISKDMGVITPNEEEQLQAIITRTMEQYYAVHGTAANIKEAIQNPTLLALIVSAIVNAGLGVKVYKKKKAE